MTDCLHIDVWTLVDDWLFAEHVGRANTSVCMTNTVCKRGMHQSWWGEHQWWNSWQWHHSDSPQHLAFLAQQLFQLWQWFCCGWKFLLPSSVFQCGLTHCKAICFSLFWPSSCASQVVQWRDPNAKQQLDHIRTTSSSHLFVPANQQLSSVIYSSRLGSVLPHEQLQLVKQDCGNSMLHFFRLVWNGN